MKNYNRYRPPQAEKNFVAKQEKKTTVEAKCSPLYFAVAKSGLCEAVNPLIKQSAEEILHTLLNDNKNKFQEENHHFIFSMPYGKIP